LEWNNSAIMVIFLLIGIPIVIVLFLLRKIITLFPDIHLQLYKFRNSNGLNWLIFEISLLSLSIAISVGLLFFISSLKGGGLLE
jgi:hypothetical protein